MKKVTVVRWLGSCALVIFGCHGLLSLAAETDQRTTSGNVHVLLPDGPQDLPETAKPVDPLQPDQELAKEPTGPNNQLAKGSPSLEAAGESPKQNQSTQESSDQIVLMEDIQAAAEKGTKNWLDITYAPKQFQFKVKPATESFTTVYAEPLHIVDEKQNQSVTWPNYLQITDERGRGSGWTLNVKQEAEFTSNLKNSAEVLAGAQLSLGTAQRKAELLSSGGNEPYKPDTAKEKITLTPKESVDLIVAHTNQGLGTWIYRFGNEQTLNVGISLTFPTAAYTVGGYTSTLIWSILDAPVS